MTIFILILGLALLMFIWYDLYISLNSDQCLLNTISELQKTIDEMNKNLNKTLKK